MAINTNATKIADLVNPEVLAPMIRGALDKAIRFTRVAAVDNTLSGQPGNTITIPKYAYIGAAETVAEGAEIPIKKLTKTTAQATIQKAGVGIELTDEAILSAYGDPVGEAGNQIALSIADKIDNDCLDALTKATKTYDGSAKSVSYSAIVDACDLFQEETDSVLSKVMFVPPAMVTTLRKDENFLSIDKYPITNGVVMTGAIGTVAGVQIVPTRRITATENVYKCPIMITSDSDATGVSTLPALTLYMKRNLNVENDRDITTKSTVITADEHYVAAVSNDSKVVVASLKA